MARMAGRLGRLAMVVVMTGIAGMAAQAATAQSGTGQAGQGSAAAPVDPATQVPAPRAEDVATPHSTVQALYEVISGDAGVKRDWNRFRSLFHPRAQMVPTGKHAESGQVRARVMTPEDYVNISGAMIEKKGFHEAEIAYREERYGNISHIFTTYAARHKASDPDPFMRGINSVQLFNDGKRWWILNIIWSPESPEHPLPEAYLKNGK